MNRLMLDRRSFLAGAGAALLSSSSSATFAKDLARSDNLFASAFRDTTGRFGLAIFDEAGTILKRHMLPERGHGIANNHSSGYAVIFARRPESFALAFDPRRLKEPVLFHTPDDRHFYGHGTFSNDGKLLYAAENDFENGSENGFGIIGIYDASNQFKRLGEFSSGGIGPHEIVLYGQDMICVANGGIKTHPEFGREKLNLDNMASKITFIDLRSGHITEQHNLPAQLQRLSLRHLAVDQNGVAWLGGQYQGSRLDQVPLLAKLEFGSALEFLKLPGNVHNGFGNYIGSVAINVHAGTVAFTSPVGGQVVTIDQSSHSVLDITQQQGVCGIAGKKSGFIQSTDTGSLGSTQHQLNWDNHIRALKI